MRRSRRRQQRGVIFLALILVLVVGGSAFTLSALNNRQSAKLSLERDVYEEMELVRQALISYARYTSNLYPDAPGVSPGLLPCPDLDNDGLKDLFVSNGYRRVVTNLDYVAYLQTASQFGVERERR